MAYAELDRAYIRHFVGYGAIFMQAEPRLENAITATQSSADGGSRPDSSTENVIKGLIYGTAAVTGVGVTPGGSPQSGPFAQPAQRGLLQVETSIATMDSLLGSLEVDGGEVKLDTARETARLRSVGRVLCHSLARMLGMKGVRADVFSSSPVINDTDPFAYSNLEHWRGGP